MLRKKSLDELSYYVVLLDHSYYHQNTSGGYKYKYKNVLV